MIAHCQSSIAPGRSLSTFDLIRRQCALRTTHFLKRENVEATIPNRFAHLFLRQTIYTGFDDESLDGGGGYTVDTRIKLVG